MKNIIDCFKIAVLILICFCITIPAQGQRKVELKIIAADDSGAEIQMVAGVDDNATDSLDLKLGEQFLPGHPPAPSPIHAALLVENLLSYKNYRRIPSQNKFSLDYTINVNDYSERQAPFFFKWEYPLPKYIDSARIMDRLGGTIYSFPLDESRKSVSITNEGLRSYSLVIWYSLPSVGILEEPIVSTTNNLIIRSKNDKVTVQMNAEYRVSMYDALSNKIWEGDGLISKAEINTSSLSNGLYFILCTQPNGSIISKKIILAR